MPGQEPARKRPEHPSGLAWITDLRDVFGAHYLLAVCCYHHVLKGFVAMYAYTSFDFILRLRHVPGPRMQVLKALALLPWAFKPVFGMASDGLPVFGFRKAPYMVLASLLGTAAFLAVGFRGPELSLGALVAAFVAISVQIATCDLLTEAATAERVRQMPEHGPAMLSFVSSGITLGSALATASVAHVLVRLGPYGPCAFCALPSACMLVPALGNCLGEQRMDREGRKKQHSIFTEQSEVVVLALMVCKASLVLAAVSAMEASAMFKLEFVLGVVLMVILGFLLLLNPRLSLLNAFFFLQNVSTISVEGGTFYFFTDDACSFPLGPHFSVWFFTTGLGLGASACGLMGLAIYRSCLAAWRYRSVLLLSNGLWCVVACASALVYTRRNLELGVPDGAFVLGGSMLQVVFERWAYVAGQVLFSHACPPGLEATMFALLAGCQNLARLAATIFGASVLEHLGVSPDGSADDAAKFGHLWEAAALQALAPLVTLWLVPALIPDGTQKDHVMGHAPGDTTRGSPWSLLRERWTPSAAQACGWDAGTGSTGSSYGTLGAPRWGWDGHRDSGT